MIKKILIMAVFFVGLITGTIIDRNFPGKIQNIQNLFTDAHQVRQGGYSLINPLLECEIGQRMLSKELVSFRKLIENEVGKLKSSEKIEDMSVYFRDLNNGLGIGVNEKADFAPASLLKLPIMIAYLKQSESDPSILKKTYTYSDPVDRNLEEHVKPKDPIISGKTYTVDELIKRMIAYSDNNAMAILVENLPLSVQDRVFSDLGVSVPSGGSATDFMSVNDYASFFRILYNASYLSKENSQKALSFMMGVDFADGIRGGVPKGTPVANKFGERQVGASQQLHDCGIVYLTDHPYLLCIMSRGTDFDSLASSIRDISHLVYNEAGRQVGHHN